uniref:Uncharacterized protein n=1 Tax=Oryza barthii TaxID=65489 RepID=A0A0D3GVW0_9ORYZ
MGADAGDRGLRRLVISGLGSKGQAAAAVYSSMSRTAYNLALHEHGPKLYDKLTEDMEDHLQEMCVSIEAAQGGLKIIDRGAFGGRYGLHPPDGRSEHVHLWRCEAAGSGQ